VKKTSSDTKQSSSGKSSSVSHPQTMEELLAHAQMNLKSLSRGVQVTAKILRVNKREVIADIGAKSYGIVVGREFEAISGLAPTLKPGDIVPAEVLIPEMESGETLISLRKTLISQLWEDLIKAKESGEEISVTALKPLSGGLLVDCRSLRGFIPQQQIDTAKNENNEKLIGKKITVKVLEVDKLQNRLVLSQKEVTQKEELAQKRKSLMTFEKGEKVDGHITQVDKYVLTVSVTKRKVTVPGVIHISEISWERVEDLSKVFSVGNDITAEVVDLDLSEAVLVLSTKRLMPDPWTDIEKKFAQETQATGTIVKVTGLGVFVELEKGIEGLIHVSKLPAGREFKEGDRVPVTVDKLDKDNRKISLAFVSTTKPIGYR
jgi:small subunit ribosomal protein S1